MKSTGIRRKVDDLGRVVIPAGIRRSMGIREGDEVDVSVDGDHVILSKPIDRCVFCRSDDGLAPFRGKAVCRECVGGVSDLVADRGHQPVAAHVDRAAEGPPAGAPVPAWTGASRPRPSRSTSERPQVAAVTDEPADHDPASTTAW